MKAINDTLGIDQFALRLFGWRNLVRIIFVLCVVLLSSVPVLAHDPGLSAIDMTIEANGTSVRVGLARSDAENLFESDNTSKKTTRDADNDSLVAYFESLGGDLVSVYSDGQEL